jgi:hypothetical protein
MGHFADDADTNLYSNWLFTVSGFEGNPVASGLSEAIDPDDSMQMATAAGVSIAAVAAVNLGVKPGFLLYALD